MSRRRKSLRFWSFFRSGLWMIFGTCVLVVVFISVAIGVITVFVVTFDVWKVVE